VKATEKQVACRYCGNTDPRLVGSCSAPVECAAANVAPATRELAERIRLSNLYECCHCHLLFRDPQLSKADLALLYQTLPAAYWSYDEESVGSWVVAKRFLESEYSDDILRRILDVGAFEGAFLRSLPSKWEKWAIEPSVEAQLSLKKNGIAHLGDFLDASTISDGLEMFDVVTIFDVFEHLPDPRESLRVLISLLRPGGLLLISTGNAAHWTWKMLHGKHWYLHSVQHLHFATRGFLAVSVPAAGAKVEKILLHSHKLTGTLEKWRQSIETVHFGFLNRGTFVGRLIARAIQSLPCLGYLRHQRSAPFGNAISDHMMAIIRRAHFEKSRAIACSPTLKKD
jgi:2-polyprenyl-3-methyl-5-hydroxy-6-metoxy-1,4-benzoquinol methylase